MAASSPSPRAPVFDQDFPDSILDSIIRVTGSDLPVALHAPTFTGDEWHAVKECLDSGWVSSAGPAGNKFEALLAQQTGADFAVLTVNGTSALHLALLLAGVQPGDEVLLPALTFVATANAVHYCQATPHFVDIAADTLTIAVDRLDDYLAETTRPNPDGSCQNRRSGRTIRAVIAMHTFGHPADMDALLALCADYNLVALEDAAEALGSRYKKRHVGTLAAMGILSFNGNKIITTGGGGALLTNDPDLARAARHLSTTAKLAHPWEYRHDQAGFNYRLPDLNAALGCAQLAQLDAFVTAKRQLAQRYQQAFADIPDVRLLTEPSYARSNYWLNTLILGQKRSSLRDAILQRGRERGLQLRPCWELLHTLPMYQDCPRMPLPASEDLVRRIINIPSSPSHCLPVHE